MGYRPHGSRQLKRQGVAPLAVALLLTVGLWGLFPMRSVDTLLLDPAILAGGFLGGQVWFVNRYLVHSWPEEGLLAAQFGLANSLTMLRGALYAVVAGFVVVPPGTKLQWVPAAAYGIGVLLDKLDGVIARTVGEETDLGERLDMAFDTFGFVAAPLVAVLWGWLPVWYLSLSAARYVYRGSLAWRQRRGKPLFEPPDSDLGRYLAGLQMVFLTAALIPSMPTRYVFAVAPFVLAPSLLVFARDYLVVTGRIARDTACLR